MPKEKRAALLERFWELQEPDIGAYSRRIKQLLDFLTTEQLKELVNDMQGDDEE